MQIKVPIEVKMDMDEIINRLKEYDFVQVVRCKDCRWYIESDVFNGKDCTHFSGLKTPNPDDYCSYAERRDDETD